MASVARAPGGSRSMALLSVALLALLVLLAMVLPPAAAQIISFGDCPEQDVVQNFDVPAYLGKWYEQERFFAVFQIGGECVTANYTDEGDGVVGVKNTQTNAILRITNSITGTATLAGDDGEAKLTVRFPSVGNFPAPYWILDTDYDNYAIVWSCTSILGFSNSQFAWVLTREKHPSDEVMATVKDVLTSRQLPLDSFHPTRQDCEDN